MCEVKRSDRGVIAQLDIAEQKQNQNRIEVPGLFLLSVKQHKYEWSGDQKIKLKIGFLRKKISGMQTNLDNEYQSQVMFAKRDPVQQVKYESQQINNAVNEI